MTGVIGYLIIMDIVNINTTIHANHYQTHLEEKKPPHKFEFHDPMWQILGMIMTLVLSLV